MQLSRFVQWIVIAVIWSLLLLTTVILVLMSMLITAWTMPIWWVLVLIAIGLFATSKILDSEKFAEINHQIADKLADLNDAEILEVMQAMDKVKEDIGIQIDLPLKSKKHKREDIDRAIRNLSDTELVHLKDRLREGNIEEEKLMAWLADQNEMTE